MHHDCTVRTVIDKRCHGQQKPALLRFRIATVFDRKTLPAAVQHLAYARSRQTSLGRTLPHRLVANFEVVGSDPKSMLLFGEIDRSESPPCIVHRNDDSLRIQQRYMR